MKSKNRKLLKHRKTPRHHVQSVPANRRRSVKKNKVERASTPWLRIVPTGIDDEPSAENFREFLSHRNGRSQPQDLDLNTPEDNFRSR
jgi:hypothetical protein